MKYNRKESKPELNSFNVFLHTKGISESTSSDYEKRLLTICEEEGLTIEDLKENIKKIYYDYNEGEKADLGRRSHNSYRSALKKYLDFVSADPGQTTNLNTSSLNTKYSIKIKRLPEFNVGLIRLLDEKGDILGVRVMKKGDDSKKLVQLCWELVFEIAYTDKENGWTEIFKKLGVAFDLEGKILF